MDDEQKELLKTGVETLLRPFTDLMERLFGGPADEIGATWSDALKARRILRQIELLKKVSAAIEAAGFEPRQIPDKIWMPILEGASLEDDEDLREKWANLLANAADPRVPHAVLPSFSAILKELTSRDAKFLAELHKRDAERKTEYSPVVFTRYDLSTVYAEAGLSRSPRLLGLSYGEVESGGDDLKSDLLEFSTTLQVLLRNGILGESVSNKPIDLSSVAGEVERGRIPRSVESETVTHYHLTDLGRQFVIACEAPSARTHKPRSKTVGNDS